MNNDFSRITNSIKWHRMVPKFILILTRVFMFFHIHTKRIHRNLSVCVYNNFSFHMLYYYISKFLEMCMNNFVSFYRVRSAWKIIVHLDLNKNFMLVSITNKNFSSLDSKYKEGIWISYRRVIYGPPCIITYNRSTFFMFHRRMKEMIDTIFGLVCNY